MILYISASFLGPLHMSVKEDDLDSSTLVRRSHLQYIILSVSLTSCILFQLLG